MKISSKHLTLIVSALKAARFHIIWKGESEIGSSVVTGIDISLQILDNDNMCDGCGVRPGLHKNSEESTFCTPCRDGIV